MKNLLLLAGAAAALYALTRRASARPPLPPAPLSTGQPHSVTGLIIDKAEWTDGETDVIDVTEDLSLMLDQSGVIVITPTHYLFGGEVNGGDWYLNVWFRVGAAGAQQTRSIPIYAEDILP